MKTKLKPKTAKNSKEALELIKKAKKGDTIILDERKTKLNKEIAKIEKEIEKKFILDACCGMKYMWYNKNHPNTIYMDIRKEEKGFNKNRPFDEVKPDVQGDFTNLPEEIRNKKFKLIVWDVPHFKARRLTGNLLKCYGGLNPETWQEDIKGGFNQLWSVLDEYGVLLFKFSDYHIKFKDVLKQIPEDPLFYNITNSTGRSDVKWFCFMKIPDNKNEKVK